MTKGDIILRLIELLQSYPLLKSIFDTNLIDFTQKINKIVTYKVPWTGHANVNQETQKSDWMKEIFAGHLWSVILLLAILYVYHGSIINDPALHSNTASLS